GARRLGDAPGRGDQEVPRPTSRVANRQGEQFVDDVVGRVGTAGLRGPLLAPLDRVVYDRVERRVQQALDQRRWRVVTTRRLPTVARDLDQLEGAVRRRVLRLQLQQRLVDRA